MVQFGLVWFLGFEEIQFLKNCTDWFQKILGTKYFGSILVLTELTKTFLPEAKITRKAYMFYDKFR